MIILQREKICFYTFLVFFLLPVLLLRFFPTTDGPAHLYNASLIKQLLFDPTGIASTFFQFNPSPQPNWIGHVLLTSFQCLFPAWLSEKLLLVLYVAGMAFSFRALVLQMKPDAGISTCLIFPFIYTFIFYLGFYNFLLSIPVVFFTCWYCYRHLNHFSKKKLIALAVLFLTIYFSHLLSFAIAIVCVFVLTIFLAEKKDWTKHFVFIFCSLAPCLILTGYFALSNELGGFKGTVDYLPVKELTGFLTEVRPLICYTHEEVKLSQIIFYVFSFLIVAEFINRFIRYRKNESENLLRFEDVWLLFGVVSIILLFAVPDNIASGGFVSVRLSLFVFLFFALWLAIIDSFPVIKTAGVLIVLFMGMKLNYDRFNATLYLSNEVRIVERASGFIKDNSVVLPLNYSTRWTTVNTLNYVGCIKNVVVLDNYEASHKVFPLLWKPEVDPSYLGDQGKTNHPCIHILDYEKRVHHKIDYVITFQRDVTMNDLCAINTVNQLNTLYNKIFTDETGLVEVYERK